MLANSILKGITSTASSLINTAFSHWQYGDQKKYNSAEAQKQREYETEMSNTAYQRATEDMKKAGLNPAMMYGSGSAASTPSVSAASVGANGGTPVDLTGMITAISEEMNSAANLIMAVGRAPKGSVAYKVGNNLLQNIKYQY